MAQHVPSLPLPLSASSASLEKLLTGGPAVPAPGPAPGLPLKKMNTPSCVGVEEISDKSRDLAPAVLESPEIPTSGQSPREISHQHHNQLEMRSSLDVPVACGAAASLMMPGVAQPTAPANVDATTTCVSADVNASALAATTTGYDLPPRISLPGCLPDAAHPVSVLQQAGVKTSQHDLQHNVSTSGAGEPSSAAPPRNHHEVHAGIAAAEEAARAMGLPDEEATAIAHAAAAAAAAAHAAAEAPQVVPSLTEAQLKEVASTSAPAGSSATPLNKGSHWSEQEHLSFLLGLQKLGKGNWRALSRVFVPSRTPVQVASHAQKHFLRHTGLGKRNSRFASIEKVFLEWLATDNKALPSTHVDAKQTIDRFFASLRGHVLRDHATTLTANVPSTSADLNQAPTPPSPESHHAVQGQHVQQPSLPSYTEMAAQPWFPLALAPFPINSLQTSLSPPLFPSGHQLLSFSQGAIPGPSPMVYPDLASAYARAQAAFNMQQQQQQQQLMRMQEQQEEGAAVAPPPTMVTADASGHAARPPPPPPPPPPSATKSAGTKRKSFHGPSSSPKKGGKGVTVEYTASPICRPIAHRADDDNNAAVKVVEKELAAAVAEANEFGDAMVPVVPGMLEPEHGVAEGGDMPKRMRLSAFSLASEGPVWTPRIRVNVASAMKQVKKWEDVNQYGFME